ncbi:MAG: hypothetical protein PHI51_03980 [Candidatus Peribacteraceae bacterium]|nr:hypothetical protein [Candidatus Peribacteraceae bacterium]
MAEMTIGQLVDRGYLQPYSMEQLKPLLEYIGGLEDPQQIQEKLSQASRLACPAQFLVDQTTKDWGASIRVCLAVTGAFGTSHWPRDQQKITTRFRPLESKQTRAELLETADAALGTIFGSPGG